MIWWWFLSFSAVVVLLTNFCVLLLKSCDDSSYLKKTKVLHHFRLLILPPWDLETIHDYLHVCLCILGKMANRLVTCIFMAKLFLDYSLFVLYHFMPSFFSAYPQTNNHCFLLSPGLPPAVLMSTGKWQNQPGNEEAHKETFCSSSRRRVLRTFKMPAKPFASAEVPIWEILEEFSHLANFLLVGIK